MRDLNIVTLRGRLGQDAEIRSTSTGKKVTVLNVATNRSYKDKQTGEWKDGKTEWHRCLCWEKKGEKAATLKKGDPVQVTGTLTSREYEKDGVKRQVWEIRVNDLLKVAAFDVADEDETSTDLQDEEIPY